MAKRSPILLPKVLAALHVVGENLRLARLRRNITAKLEAERAGISVMTLEQIEKGSPAVAMGSYVQVLFTLGLLDDLLQVALDDELGRKLQDAGLRLRARASRRTGI